MIKTSKKKLTFVLDQMNQGGPAKDFLNLCEIIDYERFQVILILLKKEGQFYKEIPENIIIKLAEPKGLFESYDGSIGLNTFKWRFVKLLIRITAKLLKVTFNLSENTNWLLTEFFIKKNPDHFDLGMSLVEGKSNYYLTKFINADIKVGRIPTDYKVAKLDSNFDRRYFKKLDYIATNSKINLDVLRSVFPEFQNKFLLVDTIVNPEKLHIKAKEGKGFISNFNGVRIVTLSRLDDTKGTDIAVKACKILVESGFKSLRWYVFGNGVQDKYLKMIQEYNIEEHFFLMGPVNNPYPFVSQCNIYVQPSTYEGNSNAVKEAKALYKPVILTNFNTAKEHVTHLFDGVIANEINEIALATSIQALLLNPELIKNIEGNLKKTMCGNKEEFNKILNLI